MSAERNLNEPFAEGLRQMVVGARIEIIPSDKILNRIDLVPQNSVLSVTASPTREIEETLDLSKKLLDKGYKVVPHLAARRIRNHAQLMRISDFLDENNIAEIFAVGGDGEPFGEYSNSFNMLQDLLKKNKSLTDIGISGYPEGHPLITDSDLIAFLKAKIGLAKGFGIKVHINSQACYDPEDIEVWLNILHKNMINEPVLLGISAPMNLIKLAQTSKEIGVGDSVAFLKMVGFDGALKPAVYSPDSLLNSLAEKQGINQIKGLHLFTFNHIKASIDWQKSFSGK